MAAYTCLTSFPFKSDSDDIKTQLIDSTFDGSNNLPLVSCGLSELSIF